MTTYYFSVPAALMVPVQAKTRAEASARAQGISRAIRDAAPEGMSLDLGEIEYVLKLADVPPVLIDLPD